MADAAQPPDRPLPAADANTGAAVEADPESAATADADTTTEAGDDERSPLSTVASTIADAATPVVAAVGQLAGEARRRFADRPGAHVRRVRRMASRPLPNLWEIHPEARNASFRELEPRVVPVEQIVGTAVEGPVQRGGDFLPVRDRRGMDWRARWQRILRAVDELANLPPVDLIKFGDEYWVVDGHNRVAAALYTGQVGLDANALEARLPGVPAEPTGRIAPYLEGSRELRQAGQGRLTRAHGHDADDDPPPRAEQGEG